MRYGPHRAILRIVKGAPAPALPDGLRVVDRRTVSVPATGPGQIAHMADELLVVGDCLAPVRELEAAPRRTLAELERFAADWWRP